MGPTHSFEISSLARRPFDVAPPEVNAGDLIEPLVGVGEQPVERGACLGMQLAPTVIALQGSSKGSALHQTPLEYEEESTCVHVPRNGSLSC